MIIDGRAIAEEILSEIRARVARAGHDVVLRAITVQPAAVTESYLRTKSRQAEKADVRMDVVQLPGDATTEDVLAAIEAPGADAIIVQLPLPEGLDRARILNAISMEKDADVLSSRGISKFAAASDMSGAHSETLFPPVIAAMREVLLRAGISPAGKQVVVVGAGALVGKPAATWLTNEGAAVSVITLGGGDQEKMKNADIIVLGAGSPGILKPEHIKEGVVILDGGTSESGGSIIGDADPACAVHAAVFTPVPGGIGPISVACLLRNAADLALGRTVPESLK